jgi:tRNA/tmRNA/rRNA uracil-C5-methylase (TrmA/RlmC/RlmD family)
MVFKKESESKYTLSDILSGLLIDEGLGKLSGSEPLARLDYADELALKEEAIKRFWHSHSLPSEPDPIIASVLPRGYRSTSKRRAAVASGRLYLLHPGERPGGRGLLSSSLLEPAEHWEIFNLVHRRLSRKEDEALARHLNWVVVRGLGKGCALILNTSRIDATVVRKAKQLSEKIKAETDSLASVFLYYDPSRSHYYLEAGREAPHSPRGGSTRIGLKCLSGPSDLGISLDSFTLRFPPHVFSQINQSMIGSLIGKAKDMLKVQEVTPSSDNLLDLYCGYGLFSFGLGPDFRGVTGLELAGPAIEAARRNFERISKGGRVMLPPMRFLAGRITPSFLEKVFRASLRNKERLTLVLDPPRQGTGPRVIEALSDLRPRQVLHIFCNIDKIPQELRRWAQGGYRVIKVSVLDLFPGTSGVETLVLLGR